MSKETPQERMRARALVVRVEVTTWTARKLDKATRDKVARDHNASRAAVVVTKRLLGGNDAKHNAVVAATQNVRNVVAKHTLPYSDRGQRLLATAHYFEFQAALSDAVARWEESVADFCNWYADAYRDLRAEIGDRLGDLLNPAEYPSPASVRKRFGLDVSYEPLPDVSDVRFDLPDDIVQSIGADVETRVSNALNDALRAGIQRLYESIYHVREKLDSLTDKDGKATRLHQAVFDNAVESARIFKSLNIFDDKDANEIADRIIDAFTPVVASAVRNDDKAVAQIIARVDDIISTMEGLYA